MSTTDQRFIPAYAGNSLVGSTLAIRTIGSSPLTRGTLFQHFNLSLSQRFIPAYAGNSLRKDVHPERGTVHPRLRGELPCRANGCPCTVGSSPLTRGTQTIVFVFNGHGRFIPAYAGNSWVKTLSLLPSEVHPRLRGELGCSE